MTHGPSALVFSPAVVLTVTVEEGVDSPDIHIHAGGQGVWVARLLVELGVAASLVGPFGGEIGLVLRTLVADDGIDLTAVDVAGANGAYVHDRRSGERVVVADSAPAALSRHEVDELYGTVLVGGLEADVCVLTGPGLHPVLPPEVYGRLAGDLRANGRVVIADLSAEHQDHAVRAGVSVLKVSAEELRRDGRIHSESLASVVGCIGQLAAAGADAVVVTRAEHGSVVLADGVLSVVEAPTVEAVERRGAGDSLTAGMTAGLARRLPLIESLRLGTAAGALNVTRRGLGTGGRDEIERLAEHITVRELDVEVE